MERGGQRRQLESLRDKISVTSMYVNLLSFIPKGVNTEVVTRSWALSLWLVSPWWSYVMGFVTHSQCKEVQRGSLMSMQESTDGQCSSGNSANSRAKEAPFPKVSCPKRELDLYLPDFCV